MTQSDKLKAIGYSLKGMAGQYVAVLCGETWYRGVVDDADADSVTLSASREASEQGFVGGSKSIPLNEIRQWGSWVAGGMLFDVDDEDVLQRLLRDETALPTVKFHPPANWRYRETT